MIKKHDIKPYCLICDRQFKCLNALTTHIQIGHNLSIKDYYDRYIKTEDEGICKLCGKQTNWSGKLNYGYATYCSNYCATHSAERNKLIVKTRKTNENWFPNGVKSRESGHDDYIKKYGHDYLYNSAEYKTRFKVLTKQKMLLKYGQSFKDKNCILKDYDSNTYFAKCNKCEKDFQIKNQALYIRIHNNSELCVHCNPLSKNTSLSEQGLYQYIKTLYDNVEQNNNKILPNHKELDIYLPDIKLAFEFDGKYWHADPTYYKPDDIINGKTAKEIWDRDYEKDILCEQYGIKLIRIKEYDWIYNIEQIKNMIRDAINERKTQFL